MEKNLFENAYFGKAYKTKGEKKAIYIHHYKDSEGGDMYYLIIDGSVTTYVWGADGKIAPNYNNDELDIVSEWEEKIDEDELVDVAFEHRREQAEIVKQGCALGQCIGGFDFMDGFIAGVRYMENKGGK